VEAGWDPGSERAGEEERKRITAPINRDLRFATTKDAKGEMRGLKRTTKKGKKSQAEGLTERGF